MDFFISVFSLLFSVFPMSAPQVYEVPVIQSELMRYVSLGDSYTIGQGVLEEERWPNMLVQDLRAQGIDIELVANPSQTGWTTKQVLDVELEIFRDSDPDFATLMIGVNDYFQGVSADTFRERFAKILDEMKNELTDSSKIVIVNIPDYSVTPTGAGYDSGNVTAGIAEFNQIIFEEAAEESIAVVDVFALSQEALDKPEWIASDGLHPSGIQYRAWLDLIYPVVVELLEA
jgi:lysophospholipase L1-like esterase